VVVPLAQEVWKIRQMAVATNYQGQGLGRQVMRTIEEKARAEAVATLVLHAREDAVAFYERLGFVGEGEMFLEIGISHLLMTKRLR
jgi:predicted GNAT family N-acyltransferase